MGYPPSFYCILFFDYVFAQSKKKVLIVSESGFYDCTLLKVGSPREC